jgi:hypothetical protein
MAVTRDGLPVRSWVFTGNTNDVTTVEKVKADLKGWKLGRCVFVGDAGMNSESNRRTLSLGGGKYILASRMRADGEVSDEVLTRAGRYHLVKDNLRVKEVYVGDGERRQRYVVCHNPSEEHRQRMRRAKHLFQQRLRKYTRVELLVCDEVGYLSYDTRAADLLFQVVSERHEKRPLVLTTNLPFAQWPTIFPNASCTVALIDRVVHHADIVAIEGDSFRRREAEGRKSARAKSKSAAPDPPPRPLRRRGRAPASGPSRFTRLSTADNRRDLSAAARAMILDGSPVPVEDRDLHTRRKVSAPRPFLGFRRAILDRSTNGGRHAVPLAALVRQGPCYVCGGTRWSTQARALRVCGWSIDGLLALPLSELADETARGRLATEAPPLVQNLVANLHRMAASFLSVGLGAVRATLSPCLGPPLKRGHGHQHFRWNAVGSRKVICVSLLRPWKQGRTRRWDSENR